ncbi:MAG: hypothetical protein H0X25_22145 [Acidobacteriales bacterium]|nr:hypothetical protein [Terriglobales bacterium]
MYVTADQSLMDRRALESPGCVPPLQQQPGIDGTVTLGDFSVNSILNSLPIPSLPGNTNIGGVAVNGPAVLGALGLLAAALYLFGGKSARSRSSKRSATEKKRLKRITELTSELDAATRERL